MAEQKVRQMMVIQAIADTHGENIQIEEADMYVLLGDNSGAWIFDLKCAAKKRNTPVLCLLGNHDDPAFPLWYPEFIHQPFFVYRGIRFGCIEGCLSEESGPFLYTEKDYTYIIKNLPECDIILSHPAPYGIFQDTDVTHRGIKALTEKIQKEQPKLCLYGHMHTPRTDYIGKTECRCIYKTELINI